MCLAIYTEQGKELTKANLQNGFNNNPDGWGIAYTTKYGIVTHKDVTNFKAFFSAYNEARKDIHRKSGMLIHFRYATHGNISRANAHPFMIGTHTAMIHNGMIDIVTKAKESDTAALSRILSVIPEKTLHTPEVGHLLTTIADKYNKFVLLRRTGQVTIIGEDLGHWDGATWYSNKGYKYDLGVYKTYPATNGKVMSNKEEKANYSQRWSEINEWDEIEETRAISDMTAEQWERWSAQEDIKRLSSRYTD